MAFMFIIWCLYNLMHLRLWRENTTQASKLMEHILSGKVLQVFKMMNERQLEFKMIVTGFILTLFG